MRKTFATVISCRSPYKICRLHAHEQSNGGWFFRVGKSLRKSCFAYLQVLVSVYNKGMTTTQPTTKGETMRKATYKRTGQEVTVVARHEDYAEPMNECRFADGHTGMLKDSEITIKSRFAFDAVQLWTASGTMSGLIAADKAEEMVDSGRCKIINDQAITTLA